MALLRILSTAGWFYTVALAGQQHLSTSTPAAPASRPRDLTARWGSGTFAPTSWFSTTKARRVVKCLILLIQWLSNRRHLTTEFVPCVYRVQQSTEQQSTASPFTRPATSWSLVPVTAQWRYWTCWRDALCTLSMATRWHRRFHRHRRHAAEKPLWAGAGTCGVWFMVASVFQGPVFTVAFSRGGDLFSSGGADAQVCAVVAPELNDRTHVFSPFLNTVFILWSSCWIDQKQFQFFSGYCNVLPHKHRCWCGGQTLTRSPTSVFCSSTATGPPLTLHLMWATSTPERPTFTIRCPQRFRSVKPRL